MDKALPKAEFYEQLDTESKDYEAVKEVHDMGARASLTDHDHRLSLVSGHQAECQCGWGIYLDMQDELRDGKLYRDGLLVI